jgi:hypothetical protein
MKGEEMFVARWRWAVAKRLTASLVLRMVDVLRARKPSVREYRVFDAVLVTR